MNLLTRNIFLMIIFGWIASACEESPKNIETETVELSFKEVFLKENNKRLEADSFPKVRYGTKLEMYISDFEGYNLRDDKAFLGCAVTVADTEGNQIQKQDDILSMYDEIGISPKDAKNLMTSMLVNAPLEVGKKYVWTARLWDKIGAGEITATTQIQVVSENPIQISEKGLQLDEAFIISYDPKNQEATRLHNNRVKAGTELKLHLAGLKGFMIKDGKTDLGCTLEIKDSKGELILIYKDMFEPYPEGVQPKEVEQMTINLVMSTPPKVGERYDLLARVWDKSTEKSTELALNFEILP